MKKAKLLFQVDLDYQTKSFKPLASLGERAYDKNKKRYTWTFPINNVHKVLAVLGRPIKFSPSECDIVLDFSKDRKKTVKRGPAQGVGFINVQFHPTKPNYFMVTTVRDKKPQNTNVSFDTVTALWRVIKKQPLNKKVLTGTVAGNYCHELGIVDFDTYKDDKFNWKYFSGSRKYYLVFYAAIKVLSHFGVIEHIIEASKSGIMKKVNDWSIQTELEVK